MNIRLRTALCAAVLPALAGCASGGGIASYPAGQDMPPRVELQVVDDEYVAAVERYARRSGAQVEWVNLPRKRVASASVSR